MSDVFVAWGLSALVLVGGAAFAGRGTGRGYFGLLLSKGSNRVSLTNFQLTLWTIVILSLYSGFFFARLFNGVDDPLGIVIPGEILVVMGISVGSATVSKGIAVGPGRASQQAPPPGSGPTPQERESPHLFQAVTTIGPDGSERLEITRFQNFWLTIIAVIAYVALAISVINDASSIAVLDELPGFDGSLNTLLAISHGGYILPKALGGPPPPTGPASPAGTP